MRSLAGKLVLVAVLLLVIGGALERSGVRAAANEAAGSPFPLLPYYGEWGSIATNIINFRFALADRDRNRLYAVSRRGLVAFDTKGRVQIADLPDNGGDALVLSPDGRRLYIYGQASATGRAGSVITVFDTTTLTVANKITVPCGPGGATCTPNSVAAGPGNRLYVASRGALGYLILDGSSGALLRTVAANGYDTAELLTTRGNSLYTFHPGYNNRPTALIRWDISALDPVQGTAVAVGHPLPKELLVSPDGTMLLSSADYFGFTLYRTDTMAKTGAVLNEGDGFAGVADLFYGRADISADSRSILAQVSTNGALVMVEFDRDTLRPIRVANQNPANAYYPRGMVALAGGDVAQVYSERVALLSPNDYVAAMPSIFTSECYPGEVFDTFDDPESGWPIKDDGKTAVGLVDGTYRILQRQPEQLTVVTRGDFWANSFLYEVKGWRQSGSGSVGFVFGLADDWSELYLLEIVPATDPADREAFLLHYTDFSGWELLQGFELGEVLHGGSTPNTFRMEPAPDVSGNPTTGLFVNGYRLPTVVPYFIGRIGLAGASFKTGPSEARFDNYHFINRDCSRPDEAALTGPDSRVIERPPLAELRRTAEIDAARGR